nr:site-specific integrase [uncultured Draconibacterium sp.]
MISFKNVLRSKKLSYGKYPIYLRISKDRKSIFFRTPYTAEAKEWDSKKGIFKQNATNYLNKNRVLFKLIDQATNVVTELQQKKSSYTLTDVERAIRVESNPAYQNVYKFWDELIDEMIKAGRTGNAQVNRDTYNSVKKYNKKKVLNFNDITPTFLDKYEVYLRSRNGTDGGISVRMRTLRALFNFAIKRGLIKPDNYPFKSYRISKLKGKGAKRALTYDDVVKIVNKDLGEHPELVDARNYFVFSFYTRGMNYADMMKLEWKDVIDGQIYYTRSKTKANFRIKILPPVQKILNYYKEHQNGSKYVFPILLKDDMSPTQIENRKKKTLTRYNQKLKEIAKLCKFEKNVSSYVARHSYANSLKQKGVSTDIISESMGHQNLAITQAYLKELDNSLVDEAMEVLL